MGSIASRQNAGVEEVDIGVNHAYRYPPKSGNYFSSHFIMGGERFDTAQPEMYLFGENMDVNFLGSRPAPFPYPAPTANEPSKPLRALINIRKESLKFVKAPDECAVLKESEERTPTTRFNIDFTFDCDVRCAITIMYFCTEEVTTSGMIYTPRDPSMNSETYHYKRGANQQFSQACHVFDPSLYPEEDLIYSFDREVIPIVIYCVAEEGEDPPQSHATFAVVEKHSDGFALKPLKQKLFVDGLSYLLQEIYGIENKNAENSKVSTEEDAEDNGAECVICMCDLRDTLILPCRHLCLCNCCADSLRYQANNCPICRAPFRALLQIKALQKSTGPCTNPQSNPENGDNIPPGYEHVSLIEALNGPSVAPPQPSAPPAHELYVQLPQSPVDAADTHARTEASRCFIENMAVRSGAGTVEDSTTQTERPPSSCEPSNPPSLVTEPVDPAETRSLLDEDRSEVEGVNGSSVRALSQGAHCIEPVDEPRAPQAEAEIDDEGDESQEIEEEIPDADETSESLTGLMDSAVGIGTQQEEGDDISQTVTGSPILTPRKTGRRGHSGVSSDSCVAPPSPSGGGGGGAASSLSHQSESLSLPGTPLSNASAISRSSDASVSSASSTRALLSHPTDGSPSSVV
ncbi:probable E3 ubiquitin-protein ligase MGRN1 isoform X8 [Macrobrachium rosenbergii]|uniref:probable E3 ubiquitin-protein ligase MGRN1 isoform X8 n=1 Tax=Macrobrachium rosenbergii TaxID=79674 RepID=UPI0034D53FE4